jgi:hypothetical protein
MGGGRASSSGEPLCWPAFDAAGAVTEGLVLGASAGAQRGPGLAQRPLGGVQDKIAADQQRPAGVSQRR